MNFKKLSLAAVATALISTGAQAGVIALDSFVPNQPSGTSLSSTGGAAVSDTLAGASWWTSRTLTISNVNMGTGSDISQPAEIRVSGNALRMSNGIGVDSTMKVTWAWSSALATALTAAQSALTSYNFVVLANDGNANAYNGIANSLTAGSTVSIGATSLASLELSFDGNAGWDLAIQSLGLSYTCAQGATDNGTGAGGLALGTAACSPAQVPVPASLALLGLGLVGLGAVRRRA